MTATPDALRLWTWSATDPGHRRDRNEDSVLAEPDLGVVAVCDGMGGHNGGATASRMGVESLLRAVRAARRDLAAALRDLAGPRGAAAPRTTQPMIAIDGLAARRKRAPGPALPPHGELLRAATTGAAARIHEAGRHDPDLAGMGTTMTALWIVDDRAHGVHVGDSRAYHWRDGHLRRLTEDHTWVAEQLRLGRLRADELAASPYRHVITRSVGFEPDTEVDAFEVELEAGDGLLLCTDGLTNYLEDDELRQLATSHGWATLPGVLVDLANRRGGDDNISVVAARLGNDAS